MPEPEYLTVEQARLRLGGISHTKMSELIKAKKLPTHDNIADKRSRLIRTSDVDALIAQGFVARQRKKRAEPKQATA